MKKKSDNNYSFIKLNFIAQSVFSEAFSSTILGDLRYISVAILILIF